MRGFLYILFSCLIWTSYSIAFVNKERLQEISHLELCNISNKPVSFAIYYMDKNGYTIKYSEYTQPTVLAPQQAQLIKTTKNIAFTAVPLPNRVCRAWGLGGQSSDCREYSSRVALFSFSNDDIAAAGHRLASLTGDPSLNAGHEFEGGKKYFIFWNKDGFDPIYALSSGKESMNKRNFSAGKLNLIEDTTPLLRDVLQEYASFSTWRTTKQAKGTV